ncbi:MAG: hypothetical protein AAFO70_09735 [Pseudomonadota bacterium]
MWNSDAKFWAAVAGAIVLKLISSEALSLRVAAATVLFAVFSAWAFTGPVLDFFDLSVETYQIATAATLALTGEYVFRLLVSVSKNPAQLLEWLRAWRGK